MNGHRDVNSLPGTVHSPKRYAAYILQYLRTWNQQMNDTHNPDRSIRHEITVTRAMQRPTAKGHTE